MKNSNSADERVASVDFSDDSLIVGLMDGRQISVPLKWYPRLVDESGDTYLFPASCFIDAKFSKEIREAISKVA